MRYSTNELKEGVKVLIDEVPYSVISSEFHKPGKGQAVYRLKFRNLFNGSVFDKTLRSGEKLDKADVVQTDAQYLYNDGVLWHFMKTDGSYEQFAVAGDILKEETQWLTEEAVCQVLLYNGKAISVDPPQIIEIEVAETDSGHKGNTVQGGSKPAILATGARIRIPLFVQSGEKVRVNTRSGEYLGRAE